MIRAIRRTNSMKKVVRQDTHSNEFFSTAESPRASHANLIFQRNTFMLLSLFLGTALLLVLLSPAECDPSLPSSNLRDDSGRCQVSFGSFKGHQYVSEESGTIGIPKCLVESKWLKLSQHSVKFPGTSKVMDDWLWIDYHDRINVLVEDETKPGGERQFLVFEQSKYALEGKTSLAIIGGIIEPGEDPESAARREVDEEMNGLQCENFHFLGRYRTDVNRGMGWLNSFLATKCSRGPKHKHFALANEIGTADTERQDLKTISLKQLREAARSGQFLEVQWSATVALALQHPDLMI
jgi:8-oxo-dGTP pyrophosphatase MutT (NUDIX family)